MTEQRDRAALERQVIERAGQDPQFRKDLVNDTRATVERALGVPMPEGVDVSVLEETANRVYLVLPRAMPQAGEELADADLESVAGGWSGMTECVRPNTRVRADCREYDYPCTGP